MNEERTLMKDPGETKSVFKKKADLLRQDNDKLFGITCRSHIQKTKLCKKRTLEVFTENSSSRKPSIKATLSNKTISNILKQIWTVSI